MHQPVVTLPMFLLTIFAEFNKEGLARDTIGVHLQLGKDLFKQEVVVKSLGLVVIFNWLKQVVEE